MTRFFWLLYAILLIFVLLLARQAWADESTAFICLSEQSANEIASKAVISQNEADNVAGPYIAQKVCVYLPQAVTIIIVYRGTTYGSGSFRVQVVGIGQKLGAKADFYALLKLDGGST